MKARLLISLILCALSACGAGSSNSAPPSAPQPSPPVSSAPTGTAGESLPKIVCFGDSLTAGYGLAAAESYPSLLQQRLQRDGYRYEVVNAGVSGDTSAGGLRRLDWALDGDVRVLILELGANDMLRGQPVREMKANLHEIIRRARSKEIEVVLAGMYATTNLGPEYQREYRAAFEELAREQQVTLIPFFLERVAGISSLNLPDGAHPNAEGTKIVAETVYQYLKPILDKEPAAR